MFFLPVGHDKEVFHFPHVTVGIIVICVGIQLYASFAPSQRSETHEVARLRQRIWRQHAQEYARYRGFEMEPVRSRREYAIKVYRLYREFFQDYEAGRIVSKSDPQYQRYKQLMESHSDLPGVLAYGFRMRDLKSKPWTLFTHAFIHGGWMHLIGNMLFLLVCGSALEERWGRGVWTGFYLAGGALAGLTFGYFHPDSPQVLVGASGAIAAAMGAFLLLFYNTRIKIFYFLWLIFPFTGTFFMRALWVLPLWLGLQLYGLRAEAAGLPMAVAYSAHVGGFAVGVVTVLVLKLLQVDQKLSHASEKKAILYENHPLIAQGLDYAEQGNIRMAEASFSTLLREDPNHMEALLELSRLKSDPTEAVQLASQAIRIAQRTSNNEMLLYVFNDVTERGLLSYLDERAIFAAAKCYEKILPEESFVLYHRIAEHFPDSAMAPKAMLEMARIQLRSAPDRAMEILQNLTTRYQDTPFAEQAHAMMRRIQRG